MSKPIVKMMMPPAMRNPLVEIPKNLNKNWPENVKTINVINDTIVARRTMTRRCSSLMPFVMVRKTGIVPNGFVNVKNEVKHNRKKGNNDSMIILYLNYFILLTPNKQTRANGSACPRLSRRLRECRS